MTSLSSTPDVGDLKLVDQARGVGIPSEAIEFFKRGREHQASGDHYAAIEAYDSALRLAPTFIAALNNRGVELAAAGRMADALADFDRAVRQYADDFPARFNRAALRLRLGRLEDALEAVDAALASHSSSEPTRALRRQILDGFLWRAVEKGLASWSGGKPKGAEPPVVVTPGPPVSDYIVQDRGDSLSE